MTGGTCVDSPNDLIEVRSIQRNGTTNVMAPMISTAWVSTTEMEPECLTLTACLCIHFSFLLVMHPTSLQTHLNGSHTQDNHKQEHRNGRRVSLLVEDKGILIE